MNSKGYYVMHCIDGDECLLAHVPDYFTARRRCHEEQLRLPYADLSIWEAGGRIVYLSPGLAGGGISVREAITEQDREEFRITWEALQR